MTRNETARHTAIVQITVDVHECTPDGQCSGRVVENKKRAIVIEGEDRLICIRKVNEFLEKVCSAPK